MANITPYAPEALTLIKTTARKDVIYPEPHLSFDEMKILNQIKPEVHFYTPSIYQFGNINLKNKKIAISVSSPDSEELAKNHICSKHLEDITIELVRYILIAKGRVIYGGDLRHGGYTEKFEQLSNEYAYSERLSLDEDYYIENYLPWPDSLQVTENTILEYKSRHMKLIPLHSPDVKDEKRKCNFLMRAISLSQMREEMSQVSIARVLVGGKLHGYSGKMPGIMEEFLRAVKRKQPIYLIGGFGGMAQRIASGIMRKEMYNIDFFNSLVYQNPLFEMKCLNRDDILDELNVFRNLSYDILHNGLSVESNQRLFLSTDIVEIVSLLLSGMKAILK